MSRQKLSVALQIWSMLTPQSILSRDTTQGTETARQHALESHAKNLQSVQAMEKTMDIPSHWTPESAEWVAAAEKAKMRRYQCSIDTLEGLVVSRMFELTKMNMSQTGKKDLGWWISANTFLTQVTVFANTLPVPSSLAQLLYVLPSPNTMPQQWNSSHLVPL